MICSKKKEVTLAREALRFQKKVKPSDPTEPPVENLEGLVCWWCVHDLPQKPCIHLPVKYEQKLNKFTTIGNFCSWACAKAYALDMNTPHSGEIQSILALMRLRSIGHYTPLWPAPKRQFLKIFGGTMTIEEFRSFGGHTEPPQLYFPVQHQIQPLFSNTRVEHASEPTVSTTGPSGDGTRLRAIENASGQHETLKLKRTKPLARTASKLESTLGIIRKSK